MRVDVVEALGFVYADRAARHALWIPNCGCFTCRVVRNEMARARAEAWHIPERVTWTTGR